MSKLSLNLLKLPKSHPKLAIESFFVLLKKNWLVRRAWQEKRINCNNIHLRVSFPQNGHQPPGSVSQPSSSCCGRTSSPVSAVWGHGRIGFCLPIPPHLRGALVPDTLASEEGKKLQIALKILFEIANKHLFFFVINGIKLYRV